MDIENTTTPVPGINEAIDIFDRTRHLVELLFMAGESLTDPAAKNAFTTGCDVINIHLAEATDMLHAIHAAQNSKAGA